jgi:hypothetical protein
VASPTLGHQAPHHYDPWGRNPDQVRLARIFEHQVANAEALVQEDQEHLLRLREVAEVEAFCVSGFGHVVTQPDPGRFECAECDTDLNALFDLNPEEP